jgi:hypothetical protein
MKTILSLSVQSLFLLVGWLLPLCLAQAQAPTPATKPLYRQLELIQDMQPYVERINLARLFVIQTSIKNVVGNMEANVSAGKNEVTMETLRLMQNLIIQYRFSVVFFGWSEPKSVTSIYAPVIESDLQELQDLSKKLANDYGMDDSPYTQITTNTFTQMHKLLEQLETLPIDDKLKGFLRNLWPFVGQTIAVAQLGDRPKTFEQAISTITLIRNLYPQFNQISNSNAGFPMIMELQGLAEFYAEFAQMD